MVIGMIQLKYQTQQLVNPSSPTIQFAADNILVFCFILADDMKCQDLFSLKKNKRIFRSVVCCIYDWHFMG